VWACNFAGQGPPLSVGVTRRARRARGESCVNSPVPTEFEIDGGAGGQGREAAGLVLVLFS
jgi:hypothetical protein